MTPDEFSSTAETGRVFGLPADLPSTVTERLELAWLESEQSSKMAELRYDI